MYKKINDSFETAQVVPSANVNSLIKENKITKREIKRLQNKMLSGDFGKVDSKTAQRFFRHLEFSDKDVYGRYDVQDFDLNNHDIIIYYDAKDDVIYAVTYEEFSRYYPSDWLNVKRDPMAHEEKERTTAYRSTTQPGKKALEGQQREIISTEEKLGKVKTPATYYRTAYKIPANVDFGEIVRQLTKEQYDELKNLAEEYGMPFKKVLQELVYQLKVQYVSMEEAMKRTIKNVKGKRFMTKDDDRYFVATLRNLNTGKIYQRSAKDRRQAINLAYQVAKEEAEKYGYYFPSLKKILEGQSKTYMMTIEEEI